MPANLVQGSDADDVALYIAKCAGNPNCGVTAANQSAAPPPAGDSDGDLRRPGASTAAGKQVFASAGCGGCHTLKDAGATGNVGPNLDQLKPSQAKVAHQVEVGGGVMPAFKGTLSRPRSRPSRPTSRLSPGSDRRHRRRPTEPRLAEHDVGRVARAEVDARELPPAVLRVEAARLA